MRLSGVVAGLSLLLCGQARAEEAAAEEAAPPASSSPVRRLSIRASLGVPDMPGIAAVVSPYKGVELEAGGGRFQFVFSGGYNVYARLGGAWGKDRRKPDGTGWTWQIPLRIGVDYHDLQSCLFSCNRSRGWGLSAVTGFEAIKWLSPQSGIELSLNGGLMAWDSPPDIDGLPMVQLGVGLAFK